MALSSAFHERLEQMEHTRNQRFSLLQAEKELQESKSQVLASKYANIRAMEQRCLVLEQKIAAQNFKILALKSEIESLDDRYCACSRHLRVLKSEVKEIEELEKERDRFYELKCCEMKEFSDNVEKFVLECRMHVEELRKCIKAHQSSMSKLQGGNEYLSNSEIAVAEIRRSELIAVKENLDRNLASNCQLKALLQKQLQSILY